MKKILAFLLTVSALCLSTMSVQAETPDPLTVVDPQPLTEQEELMIKTAREAFDKEMENVTDTSGGDIRWAVLSASDSKVTAKITLLNREGALAKVVQTTSVADGGTILDVIPIVGDAVALADNLGDPPEIVTSYEAKYQGGVHNVTPKTMRAFMACATEKL